MLAERACWWNGHVACSLDCRGGRMPGMLVEWGCWWNGHVGGIGILVESACWWNRHLGGTGILPVKILGQAGCPPHSYSCKDSAIALHSAISRWPRLTADG
ncbi:MAG: hypothetical protein F6K26_27655 [Moorea sp. SIO2I5]|nr:hypothetical protein [Moorena sp. SIO2I5]